MKRWIIVFLAPVILFGMQTSADAHSAREGMKILLKKDIIIAANDMAYYIKPYVHRKKYKGKYKKKQEPVLCKRFYKSKTKKGKH